MIIKMTGSEIFQPVIFISNVFELLVEILGI